MNNCPLQNCLTGNNETGQQNRDNARKVSRGHATCRFFVPRRQPSATTGKPLLSLNHRFSLSARVAMIDRLSVAMIDRLSVAMIDRPIVAMIGRLSVAMIDRLSVAMIDRLSVAMIDKFIVATKRRWVRPCARRT